MLVKNFLLFPKRNVDNLKNHKYFIKLFDIADVEIPKSFLKLCSESQNRNDNRYNTSLHHPYWFPFNHFKSHPHSTDIASQSYESIE